MGDLRYEFRGGLIRLRDLLGHLVYLVCKLAYLIIPGFGHLRTVAAVCNALCRLSKSLYGLRDVVVKPDVDKYNVRAYDNGKDYRRYYQAVCRQRDEAGGKYDSRNARGEELPFKILEKH